MEDSNKVNRICRNCGKRHNNSKRGLCCKCAELKDKYKSRKNKFSDKWKISKLTTKIEENN